MDEKTPLAKVAAAKGTTVSVGVLAAYFVVPQLPGQVQMATMTADTALHGLLMALVAGVVTAGADDIGSLVGRFTSRKRT